jgi:small-conductance mechanosensitive channel
VAGMDANSVATVLLAAFVIDRLIAALMFVAAYLRLPRAVDEQTRAMRREPERKLIYFFLSGVLSLLFVLSGIIKSDQLHFGSVPSYANLAVLWLILVGGADRISQFIGKSDPPPPPPAPKQQFRVAGTLTADDQTRLP